MGALLALEMLELTGRFPIISQHGECAPEEATEGWTWRSTDESSPCT